MRGRFDRQLETLHQELIHMGALCEEAISAGVQALLEGDGSMADTAMARERDIDQKERDIEALCMIDIARRLILPAALAYAKDVAQEVQLKRSVAPGLSTEAEMSLLEALSEQTNALSTWTARLQTALEGMDKDAQLLLKAQYTRNEVTPAMDRLRAAGDALETLVGKRYWPMPTYQDLLTSV